MRVLVFNAGSSSLKYRVVEGSAERPADVRTILSGRVERIGEGETATDHASAARGILSGEAAAAGYEALAHRVVHGGERFSAPAALDEEAMRALEALDEIAPLHNGPALSVVRECRRTRPDLPDVAVFDTAFHREMPPRAAAYAIPPELAARHGIRRFGFHGIAFRSMMEQYSARAGRPAAELRLIAFHLGNGASACAIDRGRSVDTTMGFTPLEGLVMGTRSGDLDPALVPYLASREGISASDVVELLNEGAGLAGVSGLSRDAREIESAARAGNARAALALDLFAYRARKSLGACLAVLGHADAVLFGGGIGEHMPPIRAAILEGLEELGLELDRSANDALRQGEGRISMKSSKIEIRVVPPDEESIIARDAIALLAAKL
jgi:acetate kinase